MPLLASVHAGAGDGGLVLVGRDDVEHIDHMPTHGIAVSPAKDRVARLVRGGEDDSEPTLLAISDRSGLQLLRRVPVLDPHSLLWTGAGIAAASTGSNEILWFDGRGDVVRRWSPGGEGDCWHLNSLGRHRGRVISSAFGRFEQPLEWKRTGVEGRGIVYDIESESVLLGGLSAPHEAIFLDGRWIVCNSGTSSLIELDADGTLLRSVDVGGWVRGMVAEGQALRVGVTPTRGSGGHTARVATIDLATLREVASVPLASSNVFALVHVDADLVEGIRAGSRLTSSMASPAVTLDEPLSAADSSAQVSVVARPDESRPETVLTVRVVNRGRRTFSSVGTHPVYLGVRQHTDGGYVDAHRVHLPAPIRPGRSADISVVLPELPLPGARTNLCLVQEGVRWFDAVSPAASCDL